MHGGVAPGCSSRLAPTTRRLAPGACPTRGGNEYRRVRLAQGLRRTSRLIRPARRGPDALQNFPEPAKSGRRPPEAKKIFSRAEMELFQAAADLITIRVY